MTPPTFILGGHQSDFARTIAREGLGIADLMGETILAAFDATRVEASEVDTIHVGNAFSELQTGQGHLAAVPAQMVPELWGTPAMRHEGACASASLAILAAMAELEAGRYDCALIVGVEEQRGLPRLDAARAQNAAAWVGHEGIDCDLMWPATFGLLAAEYDERYGVDRVHLNRIAEINFTNVKSNPLAQTRTWSFTPESFTDDDEANPIVEPGTRRQDCAQLTDGAVALLLASPRFAEGWATRRGVSLDAVPQILGWGHRTAGIRFTDKLERSRGERHVFPHAVDAVTDAFGRADVADVWDLDGIELHDCFTSTEYMAIDHVGITEPGQAWTAIEDGTIERDGRLPVNPSGGLIGGGHPVGATGARMVLDAAKQVTGAAGDTQVDGARTFATLNIGGSMASVASFVVGVRGA